MSIKDILAKLNQPTEIVQAITDAILDHGARTVYKAANAAFEGNRAPLERLIGKYDDLGVVNAAHVAAFALLSDTDRAADYRAAASALGRLGKGKTSPSKAASARANGRAPVKPGSRPRGRPRKD